MLPIQVIVVLLAFSVSSILAFVNGYSEIAIYHIIFAIGIVPLILNAMIYFIPVLTRSKSPSSTIMALPLVALIGGGLVVSHFYFSQIAIYSQYTIHNQYLGAAIILVAIIRMSYWAYQAGKKTIGTPHPCLYWYLAAIACLCVALITVLAMYIIPDQHAKLRLLHVHLNTLGFIGITALGTLQVLLPTVTKRNDPKTFMKMHQQLKWILVGTIIIACGTAWHPSITYLGLLLLAYPIVHLFKPWLNASAIALIKTGGASLMLITALYGYVISIFIGVTHGYYNHALNPIATFIIAFLMPLVTGATSYLLPLWLRAGQQSTWHLAARKKLAFASKLRALALITAGVCVGFGYQIGWMMAAMAMSTFLMQVISIMATRSSAD